MKFELPDVSLGQRQVLDSVLHVKAGVGSHRLAGYVSTQACQPIPPRPHYQQEGWPLALGILPTHIRRGGPKDDLRQLASLPPAA